MKRVQPFLTPLLVFGAALLVRIVYNFTAARGYVPMYDAAQYERLGIHLLTEHCFCDVPNIPMTARPPLWPAIIAGIYSIFGINSLAVRLFLSVLGSGTCLLVYFFSRDLFGKWPALIAGLIAAFYPGLFIYDGWLYSESIYTFLLLAFTYTLYRFQRTSQTRWMIISGILLGLSALARQNGLFTLGLLVIWAIVVGWRHILPWRTAIRATLVITLLTLALVLPWTIRNYAVSHYIVPIATGGSTILSGAYNDTVLNDPRYLGSWVVPTQAKPPIIYHTKCCTLFGENPDEQAYAYHWIETHLTEMPHLLILHFTNIWRPIMPDGVIGPDQFPGRLSSQLIIKGMHYIPPFIFLFAALGFIATWKKRRELLPLYLVMLMTIASCVALYGSVRFRAPMEPFLVVLATGVLWWLGEYIRSQRQVVMISADTASVDNIEGQAQEAEQEVHSVRETAG